MNSGPAITPAQRVYLDEFDRFLRAHRHAATSLRARLGMRRTLAHMCTERRVPLPAARGPHARVTAAADTLQPVMDLFSDTG